MQTPPPAPGRFSGPPGGFPPRDDGSGSEKGKIKRGGTPLFH
ncbi:hypothetical protein B4135_3777 [Caldibacillus debilis]|uniref:Uncharacterized protein n=1 Tax=Caldibacillus debilis TaxID=301148 RepID=A0A150LAT7_9BACI|nr:hypothetical protein B4135_3777 [Caldibacillus debilis]